MYIFHGYFRGMNYKTNFIYLPFHLEHVEKFKWAKIELLFNIVIAIEFIDKVSYPKPSYFMQIISSFILQNEVLACLKM